MRRITICCIVFLSAALACCKAQDVRRWSEGIPDWTGFHISPPGDTTTSFASFTLLKEKKSIRKARTTYRYMDVTGALLSYQSRVREDAMTETELQAIRQDFNILEYYARQLRNELLFMTDPERKLEQEYIARFRTARDEARKTGDYSTYRLTDDTFDITGIPFTPVPQFHGITIGLFTDIPFGDQGRLLYPTAGVAAALNFGRGRSSVQAEVDFGLSSYRLHLYGLRDKTIPYVGAFVYFRQELAATDRLCISLFGGPGYAARLLDRDEYRVRVGGPALREGVSADLHLRRDISLGVRHPEQTDTFLQLRLAFGQLYNSSQHLVVPSLNLAAGLYFQSRGIKGSQP